MIPELIRAAARHLALQHDDASEGSRRALAAVIDDLAATSTDEHLRQYLLGLADGLRIRSNARRSRPPEMH